MKTVTANTGIYTGTEHVVVQVGTEPVKIDFVKQIDDLMIASPDGDVLISWDHEAGQEFDATHCMLLQQRDNMKEISNLRSTNIVLRAKTPGEELTVYATGQRN